MFAVSFSHGSVLRMPPDRVIVLSQCVSSDCCLCNSTRVVVWLIGVSDFSFDQSVVGCLLFREISVFYEFMKVLEKVPQSGV